MNSDLAITGKSPLVKEASDIVSSGDRSQGAMERMEQISNQVIGEDELIVGDLFEAFLVDGGIESDIQRTAKLSRENQQARS